MRSCVCALFAWDCVRLCECVWVGLLLILIRSERMHTQCPCRRRHWQFLGKYKLVGREWENEEVSFPVSDFLFGGGVCASCVDCLQPHTSLLTCSHVQPKCRESTDSTHEYNQTILLLVWLSLWLYAFIENGTTVELRGQWYHTTFAYTYLYMYMFAPKVVLVAVCVLYASRRSKRTHIVDTNVYERIES